MFIRRTRTGGRKGRSYTTCRLVESVRRGDRVQQRTLLNLGADFPIEPELWGDLCRRIDEILSSQSTFLPVSLPAKAEGEAQRIAARLVAAAPPAPRKTDLQEVDVTSLEMVRPRSCGVEHVGLWAVRKAGLDRLLEHLGVPGLLRSAALGSILGRMARPGSERATWAWLCRRSALGELLEVDFEASSAMSLYRASDALMRHRDAIENHLFHRITDLFGIEPTITLYDLTNTFYEGRAARQPKARFGRSKERRSDCRLLTLGLVLDGSGFVRRSRVFEGKVSEGSTLETMLAGLQTPAGARVVLDAGIATEDNLAWLRDHEYRYLVVSRRRRCDFDATRATPIRGRSGQEVQLCRSVDPATGEIFLACRSEAKSKKEPAILDRSAERFETALQKIHDGLSRPRARRRVDDVWRRIGRIQEKCRRAAQHYAVEVDTDDLGAKATAVTWKRRPAPDPERTRPGIYALRSNLTDWNDDTLWRTYTMLTDLEAVFRSLKSELGLRPIFHQKEFRADGHWFISVIAYPRVQMIRRKLQANGDHRSWSRLRADLEGQQRVTATFRQANGQTLHVRKATRAEPEQRSIYDALGIPHTPGSTRRLAV